MSLFQWLASGMARANHLWSFTAQTFNLKSNITRVYDALNRVQQTTERPIENNKSNAHRQALQGLGLQRRAAHLHGPAWAAPSSTVLNRSTASAPLGHA
jgi:hypothetical protein